MFQLIQWNWKMSIKIISNGIISLIPLDLVFHLPSTHLSDCPYSRRDRSRAEWYSEKSFISHTFHVNESQVSRARVGT